MLGLIKMLPLLAVVGAGHMDTTLEVGKGETTIAQLEKYVVLK